MHILSLLTALFFGQASATKLLLPLYQYPEGTVWNNIYTSIASHPEVEFQIIINVDSGPGGSEPNSDFATGVSKLNSYPNVQTLGYVHVLYGDASTDEVAQNTTDWAAWNSYTEANTTICGIFFDETPNSEGSDTDVTFMQTVVQDAASAFGDNLFISMMNPGSGVEHTEFWDIADFVVIFEDDASSYSSSILTANITPGKENQSAILIPEFASVGTSSEAQTWIQGMIGAGVGSAHILDYDYMEATSLDEPAPLESIAAAIGSGLATMAVSSTETSVTVSGKTAVSSMVTTMTVSETILPLETVTVSETTLPVSSSHHHHTHHHGM